MACSSVTGIGHGSSQNMELRLEMLASKAITKEDLKRQLEDYQKFAFGSNMINTCLAFALGTAFGKIINSLVNNLVMPIVNWSINATGTDWRTLTWTPLAGMKFEAGAFVGASIDFLIVTIVCFIVWKLAKAYAPQTDPPPKATV